MTLQELTGEQNVPGIQQAIIVEAETVLAKHMTPPRPARERLEGCAL